MPSTKLAQYQRKVSSLDKAGLESELEALRTLLASVTQEYRDREETIWLIMAQIDTVRNRLSDYETQTF